VSQNFSAPIPTPFYGSGGGGNLARETVLRGVVYMMESRGREQSLGDWGTPTYILINYLSLVLQLVLQLQLSIDNNDIIR